MRASLARDQDVIIDFNALQQVLAMLATAQLAFMCSSARTHVDSMHAVSCDLFRCHRAVSLHRSLSCELECTHQLLLHQEYSIPGYSLRSFLSGVCLSYKLDRPERVAGRWQD